MDETHHIYFSCEEYMKKIGHAEVILLSKIQSVWGEVVGDNIKQNVLPVKITEDTLIVMISNPAWDTQVNFFAKDILDKLKKQILNQELTVDEKNGHDVYNHVKTAESAFPVKMKTFLKH